MGAVGVGVEVASLALSAYEVANAATAPKPQAPKAPDVPKLPDSGSLVNSAAVADQQAKTAGGTILSNQRQNQIGDSPNAVRKTLLGT